MKHIATAVIAASLLTACGGSNNASTMMMQKPDRVDISIRNTTAKTQSAVNGSGELRYTVGYTDDGNPVYTASFSPASGTLIPIGTMGSAQWSGSFILDQIADVTDVNGTINGTLNEDITGRAVVTVNMVDRTIVGGGDGLTLNGTYTAANGVRGTSAYGGVAGTMTSLIAPTSTFSNIAISGENGEGEGYAGGVFLTPGL